uniref:Uncharacterized protein n=1 Tax=Lutzomyia longipalpis TaxID=7200 RepID=A0A1B0CNL5_LUTLO
MPDIEMRLCPFMVNYTMTNGTQTTRKQQLHDDFQLPEEKLAGNYAEFGNVYGLTTPSSPAMAASHHLHFYRAMRIPFDPGLRIIFLVNAVKDARNAPATTKTNCMQHW